ncbi:MAG TPA: metallophosphoesterase [Bacteroidales bacterium]
MKPSNFPFFVLIILSFFLLGNFYVCYRGIQALPSNIWIKASAIVISVFFASSYFLSRVLEKTNFQSLHQITYWVGAVWMAALLYFFLIVLFIDFVRLVNIGFHFLPNKNSDNYLIIKHISLGLAIILVVVMLVYGKWNAAHPKLTRLDLSVSKYAGAIKELNIVMVSDIHLGSLFGKEKVQNMVNKVNQLKPDVIILAGDILDEAQNPILRENIGAPLKLLNASLGVFAVTGNHEYIGGINRAVRYIESLNIKLLRDTTLFINNSFYLAGREDKDISRFTHNNRKSLEEILKGTDHHYPLILIDHQPFNLNQAVENDVDLQLSGHTHNGQFWPFNLITKRVYEVSYGYKLKGNTHVYVSSGYGTWGPPFRIGSVPEFVQIKLKFI